MLYEVITIGGGLGIGQYEFRIEDIEALVFHGTHVEEIHRHYHVDIEIVFQAEAFLIPAHGLLQADHGVLGPIQIALVDAQLQRHLPAAEGDKLRITSYNVCYTKLLRLRSTGCLSHTWGRAGVHPASQRAQGPQPPSFP